MQAREKIVSLRFRHRRMMFISIIKLRYTMVFFANNRR